MFSSIKWRFITIYFLLVFIAMSIVGIFIVDKLETQQLDSIEGDMERQIETIVESSSYLGQGDWGNHLEEIQKTLNDWRLGPTDNLYVIHEKEKPVIIATTSKKYSKLIGQNALSSKYMDPILLLEAFDGKRAANEVQELNEDIFNQHLAYPVLSEQGEVNGIVYMTSDLSLAYKTVDEAKIILTNATMLALGITVALGFVIASSITVPIRDLTKKAEKMAKGDFDQFVEVKSNDEIGQLAGMFNFLTLELKTTIQEIDYERSKLDTIFTYMAEGVIAVDRKDEIIHANIIGMNLLGLGKEDLDRGVKLDFKLLNIRNIDYDDLKSLEGSRVVKIGPEILKVKHAPFKNKIEEENIGGLIIVLQDITREHKLENMRKEFVANVSHELKTPITTIKSYAETLLEQDVDRETADMFLDVIDGEADRMNRLVMDLLQLSNLDNRKTKWKKEDLAINDLIEEVAFKLNYAIEEKNQDLNLDLSQGLKKIELDRDAIEQVISNLLSNAIKYTGEEGRIEIKSWSEEDEIHIRISDNGPGISEEDLARIFERFYRVEKGRSRELGGTGLGLSIAKEIVESHDGKLGINSELGQGTQLQLTLPCQNKVTKT